MVDPVNEELFYSEGRPSEGGRNVIIRQKDNKEIIGPDYSARSQVHEYGGAACLAYGGKVYFSDWKTKRINVVDGNATPVPITPGTQYHIWPFLSLTSACLQRTRYCAMPTWLHAHPIRILLLLYRRTIRNLPHTTWSTRWLPSTPTPIP